jgi:hypothetical protein
MIRGISLPPARELSAVSASLRNEKLIEMVIEPIGVADAAAIADVSVRPNEQQPVLVIAAENIRQAL